MRSAPVMVCRLALARATPLLPFGDRGGKLPAEVRDVGDNVAPDQTGGGREASEHVSGGPLGAPFFRLVWVLAWAARPARRRRMQRRAGSRLSRDLTGSGSFLLPYSPKRVDIRILGESTVQEIDPPRRIVWSGPAQGIMAIHVWTMEPSENRVLVHTRSRGMATQCVPSLRRCSRR